MPVSGDIASDKLDICNKKSTRQWKAASKPLQSDRDRQRLFPFSRHFASISRHFASTDDRYGGALPIMTKIAKGAPISTATSNT
jgi:hypothetical protein